MALWEKSKMTTKILADSAVCGYKNLITVSKEGKDIKINLVSVCPRIKKYSKNLKDVTIEDLYSMENSKILKKSTESRVSPSCIVPVAIMNACWIESRMMSKNLALTKKELKITFEE